MDAADQNTLEMKDVRISDPSRTYRMRMLGLAVLLIAVAVVSICLGRYAISPLDVPGVLLSLMAQWANGVAAFWVSVFGSDVPSDLIPVPYESDQQAMISIGQVRLPRILVCAMVGAALSVAGASYQGMFQNPMASQDVLGASSGAAFGAALAIFLGLGAFSISASAFVFGLVAVLCSYGISRLGRSNPILSMVLAGMVISALFSSGTSFIKLVADTENALPAITYWLMGSLASVREGDVLPVFLLLAAAIIPIFLLRWRINLLATGEEEARTMGLNATSLRLAVIICATFLTATCVSVSGLIGWVGLVIPHFVRLFMGYDYKRLIPACMLLGASFLLVVDDFSRLITTSEIPLGILTSFVGAPVFLWLIVKSGGRGGRNERNR